MFRGGGVGGRFGRLPPSRWSDPGGARHHPYRGPQNHRGGGEPGFRVGAAGFGRGFHGAGRGNSDHGPNFVKLFVGAVPRTATEEEIRPLFEEHGNVIEVIFIMDKRTGEQQSCCFVKYASVQDAERAISALHNQHTLSGGSGPVQIRYADGEKERLGRTLGPFEYKLFVSSLSKQATEKDIVEIFSQFGNVEDVYILRNDMKQPRGCCFVKLAKREMAEAAIKALHGIYVMHGCDQPLTVRFADPKKPKPGDLRGGPTFEGPRFPRSVATPAFRPPPIHNNPVNASPPHNISCSVSPQLLDATFQMDMKGASTDPVDNTQASLPGKPLLPQRQTSDNAMQTPSSLPQQGPSSTANQQPLSIPSISEKPPQHPLHQSQSSLTQAHSGGAPESSAPISCSELASAVTTAGTVITLPLAPHLTFHIPCNWSEHTCPDGLKYYYNCMTRESRWEKPDEFAEFEGQQLKNSQQQTQQKLSKKLSSPSLEHMHLEAQSTHTFRLQQAHPQAQNVC